jgi:1-acyl-sn-glycerol-3-phosphate acyltransferase
MTMAGQHSPADGERRRENQFLLLFERRFGPFFLAQLGGAFNDNVYKNALVMLVAYNTATYSALEPALLANVAAGLFILPFLLFSASAGQLADKLEKSQLIRLIKAAEILIMLIAAAGLISQNLALLLVALFLLGTQSAFFGPVKYALLPQALGPHELVGGNGLVETGTFAAILIGTLLAGVMVSTSNGTIWVTAVILAVAVIGFGASLLIPRLPAVSPDLRFNWNMFTETCANLRVATRDRTVFHCVLGVSWFWFYGALFLSQLPAYSRDFLGGSEQVVTLLLALFSVGVAAGSLLCERLSGHKVEIGLVPFGSIGLSVFAIDLFFATPTTMKLGGVGAWEFVTRAGSWRVVLDLFLIGMFGGFYIVPLYAQIQTRSEPSHRSRIIAANNIFNAMFMVVAAAVAVLLLWCGASVPQLLLFTGILNIAVAAYIYSLVPEFLLRFVDWLLVRTVYRLRIKGIENFPEKGPALLVCNHQSLADALVISAACRRPIRFLMYYTIFNIPVLNFIFRSMKAIPVAPHKLAPDVLQKAYDETAKALSEGQFVGIFPEGGITIDGTIGEFRAGVGRILERTPVPVIPMALSGLRGLFSYNPRRKWFGRLLAPVYLNIGKPIAPNEVTAAGLRDAVIALQHTRTDKA